MIYLIKSAAILEDGLGYLLKIGYTKDDGLDLRISQYKLHNPTCIILNTIPEANEVDEKSLQEHFKNYRFDGYGKEWYEYNDNIINYFNTHTTKESISYLNNVRRKEPSTRLKKEIEDAINKALHYLYSVDSSLVSIDDFKKYKDLLLPDKTINSKEDVWKYLKVSKENIEDYYNKINLKNSNLLSDYKELKTFDDRMKFICNPKLSKEEFSYVASNILISYRIYYDIVGPEKIKALGYHVTKIHRVLHDLTKVDIEGLKERVQSEFEVGKKYSKIDVKDTLAKIYEEVGYNKIAKASDIEEYLVIKDCKVTNKITKKRDNGFLIVDKK